MKLPMTYEELRKQMLDEEGAEISWKSTGEHGTGARI